MPHCRLFSPVPLSATRQVTLDAEQSRYLLRALRMQAGDTLVIFDGQGGEYPASIVGTQKHAVELELGEHNPRSLESPLQIRLVQGVSRGDRMDIVVQKATELGVHAISPVITEYSVVKLNQERAAKRREHWQKIAQSACEQCGRDRVPIVDPVITLGEWLGQNMASDAVRLMLDPDATTPLVQAPVTNSAIVLLTGPEGGFSPQERDNAASIGCHTVSMGPRVLRTETAAVAALAICQATWGDAGV